MKKNLLLFAFLCIAVTVFGQKLPFQGKLIESGTPVNDSRDFIFSIPTVGWSETHTGVSITDGMYFVVLGSINPLPDNLFAGVSEQNMDISVGGTTLSPVILFKPLTTAFEGGELQVRNTDGAIVGSFYATNDSVNKNGELELYGTNGNLNLRLGGDGPGNNQGNFSVHDADGNQKTKLSILNGTGWYNASGADGGAIVSGFKFWEGQQGAKQPFSALEGSVTPNFGLVWAEVVNRDSAEIGKLNLFSSDQNEDTHIEPAKLFVKKNGATMIEMNTQNWGSQDYSGLLWVKGPSTENIQLTGKNWENPDLPWMKLSGVNNFDAIQLSIENDSTETPYINLNSIGNGHSSFTANSFYQRGPNSTNIEFNPGWWDQPDRAILNLNGNTDENRIQLGIFEDGNQNEHGNLFLTSGNGMRINIEPHVLSIKNTSDPNNWRDMLNLSTQENVDAGTGWSGKVDVFGPTSSNIHLGSRDWESADLGMIHLYGESDFHALELSVTRDGEGNQFGWINLNSESGKNLYISPESFGAEGVGMQTHQAADSSNYGYLFTRGPNSTNFETGGDWNNPDRAYLNMNGNTDEHRLRFAIYGDDNQNEHGNIEIRSAANKQAVIEHNQIAFWNTADPNDWKELMSLRSEDNGQGGEQGVMHLSSSDSKTLYANSRNLGLRDDANSYRHLVDLSTHNDNGNGWAGYINLSGPNSGNIHLGTRGWTDPNLPVINLHGRDEFHGIELSISEDSIQSGFINLWSQNGKHLHLSPNNFGVEGVSMTTTNHVNGNFGSLRIGGPNSTNLEINPGWWDHPDRAILNMNGDTDANRITFVVENNDYGNEAGRLWTYSADERISVTEPTRTGLVDYTGGNWKELAMLSVNNNTGNGWAGNIHLSGPNSNNFTMGTDGGNPDYPFLALRGENDIDLVHIAGAPDPNNDIGYVNIFSEDGNENHLNGYGVYITSSPTQKSSFDSYQAKFESNGEMLSLSIDGISGTIPLQIQNSANVVGTLTVNGDTIASNFSDKRFKKNIQSIGHNTLHKIQTIEGVSYDWKREEFPDKYFSSRKQIGVIAQDLESQYPELVNTNADGYKSVNYNGFTAVLLEALKELNTKVEKLEAENTQLRAELSNSVKNTVEITQLQEQVQALVKLVQLQQGEERTEAQVTTPGLK